MHWKEFTADGRAQPNDGFAWILLDLDRKQFHGRVSMEWQQRRPTMKVCMRRLWKECYLKQQFFEASFTESSQETIIRQCGQCYDYGDTEGFGCTQNKSRRKCQLDSETISFHDRWIGVNKYGDTEGFGYVCIGKPQSIFVLVWCK